MLSIRHINHASALSGLGFQLRKFPDESLAMGLRVISTLYGYEIDRFSLSACLGSSGRSISEIAALLAKYSRSIPDECNHQFVVRVAKTTKALPIFKYNHGDYAALDRELNKLVIPALLIRSRSTSKLSMSLLTSHCLRHIGPSLQLVGEHDVIAYTTRLGGYISSLLYQKTITMVIATQLIQLLNHIKTVKPLLK